MSQSATRWDMLKDGLRTAIEDLPDYRVTHALFTTYAFEPEFFETSILPLLLPNGGADLSLHSALRRLQLESLLRASPISIDVYFDAHVVVPGCPLLPYGMRPVRLKDEFHGKVVLLRLEDPQGKVRCVLGAGSANLTRAGWWENLEAWHFTPDFNPAHPPAGLLPGVKALLEFLAKRSQPGEATRALSEDFDNARPDSKTDGPVFGVFTPQGESFLGWLGTQVEKGEEDERLEVISPYFPEMGHEALVNELLEATGSGGLDLWLPEDSWQSGGPAALIEEDCYDALKSLDGLHWCQMRDAELAKSRQKEQTPRFLHAKLIRQPGRYCFMGSVNFSNKAFRSNYEAGFLFADTTQPWLMPLASQPERFLKPPQQACHEGLDDSTPELWATFNWQTFVLRMDFVSKSDRKKNAGATLRLLDAQGAESRLSITLPGDLPLKADGPIYRDLQTNPWIKLLFPDGRIALAWVQQDALEYRPPPVDLRPDVWRILEMWRSLAEGNAGSHPVDFGSIEVILKHRGDYGEAPLEGEPDHNLFEEMAAAHGSFYLLRWRLQDERERKNLARCEYYLSAPRPDSLASLVERIEQPAEGGPVEAVTAWVMLQWVVQICHDHNDLPLAKALHRRAKGVLDNLLAREPLSGLDPDFLEWAKRMFLCEPSKECNVARHFKRAESSQ